MILEEIKLIGSGQEDYLLKNSCGAELEAGRSCTLHVTFAPHHSGVRKAEVNIDDGTEDGSRKVQIEGVGVQQ